MCICRSYADEQYSGLAEKLAQRLPLGRSSPILHQAGPGTPHLPPKVCVLRHLLGTADHQAHQPDLAEARLPSSSPLVIRHTARHRQGRLAHRCQEVPQRERDLLVCCSRSVIKALLDHLSVSAISELIETGIPHRRGYLFHGAPGSGKTTLGTLTCPFRNRDTHRSHLQLLPSPANFTLTSTSSTHLSAGKSKI